MSGLVAWCVALDDTECYCFAETAPKARWKAVHCWREAGYGSDGRWPSVKASRCPRFDHNRLIESPNARNGCFTYDSMMDNHRVLLSV